MDEGSFGANYRRGLVLGLTLAEIFLLLLFLLLLVFAYLLNLEEEKMQHVTNNIEAAGLSADTPEALKDSMESMSQTYKDYDALSSSFDNPEKTLQELKALEELKKILAEKGVVIEDPNALRTRLRSMSDAEVATEKYQDVCGNIDELQNLLKNLHGDDATAENVLQNCPATISNPQFDTLAVDVPETLEDAQTAIIRQRRQIASLTDKIKDITGGRGLVYPPCWARNDDPNKPVYTYNVTVKDGGIVVAPGDDRTGQDLSPIRANGPEPKFGEEISAATFTRLTRGMFNWSVRNECRFFVRVTDGTSRENKEGYKSFLATVENHFYKYLITN